MPVLLANVSGGLNRLRQQGGPAPTVLWDLTNAQVDQAGRAVGRPGTRVTATLPLGTVGLTWFQGAFHVFVGARVSGLPTGTVQHVLVHPLGGTLTRIRHALPIAGALYVVAQFTLNNAPIYRHYWLEAAPTSWTASTMVTAGQVVAPTVENGMVYRASRLGASGVLWAAGAPRAVNDVVEPTTANGFKYTCTAVAGVNPASGGTEPTWPAHDGATVTEGSLNSASTGAPASVIPSTGTVGTGTSGRYGGGGLSGSGRTYLL